MSKGDFYKKSDKQVLNGQGKAKHGRSQEVRETRA